MYKIGIGGQMSGWDQIDHEVSVSYKIDERQNICFYANWSDETSFEDGDFRVEFNYQF